MYKTNILLQFADKNGHKIKRDLPPKAQKLDNFHIAIETQPKACQRFEQGKNESAKAYTLHRALMPRLGPD